MAWLDSLFLLIRPRKPRQCAKPRSRASHPHRPILDGLEDRLLLAAGVPELLKDLALGTKDGFTTDSTIVAVGDTVFYTADDGVHGSELWRSDGTAAGTFLVKDINPAGSGFAAPRYLTNVNGTLFFQAFDSVTGFELWKSDGTTAGTVLVKDINPGSLGSYPQRLTNVNGSLFFGANDGVNGLELWKSDGTTAGTVLLKNINPGSGSSTPGYMANVNGTLFFQAADPTAGAELWKSDGTQAGTVLVKDINPGGGNSSPRYLTNVNGTLFFRADDGATGYELWKSDGTQAGTILLKDINPGINAASPRSLTNVNGTLFFHAKDPTFGYELWKSDGTAAGTILVKDISPDSGDSVPYSLTDVNGVLFFYALEPATGIELWKSDGTASGTVLVKDINPGGDPSFPNYLRNVNGTLFFRASDGATGFELWKSDGTSSGTILVKDIFPGSSASSPFSLTNVNGTLFFQATEPAVGKELWKSNGTTAGTVLVKDTNPVPRGSYARYLTNANGTLFFRAEDPNTGAEVWKSDGTTAGTVLVRDINPGSNGSDPQQLTDVNGRLFFRAAEPTITGAELWKSDGTTSGTVLVKDINPGPSYSFPRNLTNVNGTLYFTATVPGIGEELWRSDGTEAGTVLVKDINTGGNGSYPRYLTNVNGTLYFNASDGVNGPELWKSDGTAAGTVLVKNINPSSGGSYLSSLTNVNGTLFFRASDFVSGYELWKSDGTAAGTVLVKDILPGNYGSSPHDLTKVGGTLFFRATDGATGYELWKSDGTAAGTVLVKDINPGGSGSYLASLTNVNGTLFFQASDGATGPELWKSDGTLAGTILVKDINPGGSASYPSSLTNVNGTLFFQAFDSINGKELWQSDGTPAGTVLVLDINPGPAGSIPRNLVDVNGTLYFTADDGFRGEEPWVLRPGAGPTARAGGPYVINPQDSLTLNGSASSASSGTTIVSFAWDIDNNGQFNDASTSNPTIPFSTLSTLGVSGPGQHTIGLRVVDNNGLSSTAQSTFTVRTSTTTTISAPNSARFGDVVSIAATVTANSGATATGAVTFLDGGNLLGSVSLSNGSATFVTNGLSLGAHTISASYAGDTGFQASVSSSFTITIDPAAAKTLRFSVQPSNVAPNVAITPAIVVQLLNENGNVVTSDNSTAITIALGANPGAAILSGTRTVTVVNGVATFSSLSLDRRGVGYTFLATASGFTSATSAAFNVSSQRVSTWDGGGDNNRWSTPANWVGDVAPQPDDGLVFPVNTFRTLSTNDFLAGTQFDSVTIEGNGYDIAGNSIVLTSGLLSTATATNVFRLGMALTRDQTITVANPDAVLRLTGSLGGLAGLVKSGAGILVLESANTYTGPTTIGAGTLRLAIGEAASTGSSLWSLEVNPANNAILDLNNQSATLRALSGGGEVQLGQTAGSLTIGLIASAASSTYSGVISGTGNLTKAGTGALTLGGQNTFVGTVNVNGGALRLGAANVIPDASALTVAGVATFDLNGNSDTIGSLDGTGTIALTAGTLSVGFTNSSTTFVGVLSGTGGLTKIGAGTLTLTNSNNSFSGMATIAGGTLVVTADTALGLDSAPVKVTVSSGGTLRLQDVTAAYSLSLAGTLLATTGSNTWTGNIVLLDGVIQVDGSATLSVSGNLIGSGGFTKDGAKDLFLRGANNTFLGDTIVKQGKLVLAVANALGSAAAGTVVRRNAFLEFNGTAAILYSQAEALTLEECTVIVNQAGANSFAGDLNLLGHITILVNFGTLDLTGAVRVGAFTLTTKGAGTLTLFGQITGTGKLEFQGRTAFVSGDSSTSFTGATRVAPFDIIGGVPVGALFVNGKLGGSVEVLEGATLGGRGAVGTLLIDKKGTLSPGNSPETLTVSNGIAFQAESRAVFELLRNADVDPYLPPELLMQDKVIVQNGQLDLSQSPRLIIVAPQRINLRRDQEIVIFANNREVNGRFDGLPEGAVIDVGGFGTLYRINYHGGDGNDIVLTRGIPTLTTLATSTTTVAPGQSLQVTATVFSATAGATKSPGGKAILLDDGTGRGDAAVSGGQAGFNFAPGALGAGLHNFRAAYQGDDDFQPSTSVGVVGVTVQAPPATQFGAFALAGNSFLVNEKDGAVTITVSRTGGAEGAVTVDYGITAAALLPLRQQGALDKDIQAAVGGRLTFAAGETSKTLTIGIVNDNLVEDDESLIVSLGNAAGGAALGTPAGATVTIRDDDLPSVPNEAPPAARLELAGSGFGKSTEHYQDFVAKAYQRFLGRAADAAGFEYWVGLMKLYEDSKHAQGLRQEQIEAGFIASPEYVGRYGGTASERWIRGIYADLLGRTADEGGVAFWLGQRAAGVSADNVALGFTTSDERLKNRVMETYRTLLEREADAAGLAHWVAVFKLGGTTEDINSGFVGSQEYYTKPNRGNNNPAQWTRSAYLDILFRPAAVTEIDYWLRFLKG